MTRTKKVALSAGLIAAIPAIASAFPLPSYEFDVTAFYMFSPGPSDLVAGPAGSPDTGFVRFTNAGTSTFTGTLSLFGVSNAGGQNINTVYNTTLSPGAAVSLGTNDESSNQGGYNGLLGCRIELNGFITDGMSTEAVDFFVYSVDVHSGVFRTNPFGVTLDNYIIEGGDATRDTGDDFEVSQAAGTYVFRGGAVVPLPSAAAAGMATLAGFGIFGARRRRA